MSRSTRVFASTAALVLFWTSSAHADDGPSIGECLSASEASLSLSSQHQLRAERAQLLVCAAASCPADVRKECLRRVDEVTARVPTIVFDVKDGRGADLSAVTVTMDGMPLTERLTGTALALDPGEHTFQFELSGEAPVVRKLVVREAERDRHEQIVIGKPEAFTSERGPTLASVRAKPQNAPWPTQKIAAVSVGGVGIAGLLVGGIFGVVASSKWSSAKNECYGGSCPSYEQAVRDREGAGHAATVSTVAFVAGGAAAAAGAVLWFTTPQARSDSAALRVGPTLAQHATGLSISGGF